MSAAEYLRTLASSPEMVWQADSQDALRACAELVEAAQSLDDISLCENHATCRHPVCKALSVLESLARKP